jgi:hypothetical protein
VILSAEIEEDISVIIRYLDERNESEIQLRISNMLRFLRFDSQISSDHKILSDFLSFSIITLFKNSSNLDLIQEINKKIEENNQYFDELSRIDMKNSFSLRIKPNYSQVQMPKAGLVHQKGKAELNQYEKKDVVEFYPSKQNIIKIPIKDYSEKSAHVGYNPNPKPIINQFKPQAKEPFFNKVDDAPKEISIGNKDFEQTLKDLIQSCLEQSKKKAIDKEVINSMFESYEKEEITFSKQLHKILNETINNSYSEDNFEFWEMITDVSKSFLQVSEVSELIETINSKNHERGQSEQVRRGKMNSHHSPISRERDLKPKNQEYSPWNLEEKKELNQNFSQEKPVQKKEIQEKEENLRDAYNQDEKKSVDTGISCAYYGVLNLQCKDFLEKIRSQTTELAQINEPIQRMKDLLREKSPGSKLNLIGSAYSGTHIKGTEVDLNFIDFLNPSPCQLLKSVIGALKFIVIEEYSNSITFNFGEIRYCVYINLEFYYETSLLVKTYCGLDSRLKDLVTLVKFWAHKHEIYHGLLTGFHITLLCITFLQMCQPPILPLLQQGEHNIEPSGEVDIWFERNSEFFSTNTSTLGEIIAYFFPYLATLSDLYTCFPSSGQVLSNPSDMLLSCCSLFGNTEVSAVFKSSESSSFLRKSLEETTENLSNQADLYKIMRI